MLDDISFLVQETFKEANNTLKNKSLFGGFKSKLNEIPEDSSGVLFRIQRNAATFVLRIHPAEDLRSEYQNILKHPSMYPSMRFEEEDIIAEELMYYVCDDVRIGQVLKDKLGNKRFSINEEQVFNISDPGDSWWLKREDNKVSIFFKLSHTQDMSDLIKLGPLGDPDSSLEAFSKLYGYFEMLFPLEDYSSGFGQFSFTVGAGRQPIFEQLFRLFAQGDVSPVFWDYLRDLEIQNQNKPYLDALRKANYFILELAETRRFWLEIQSKLA